MMIDPADLRRKPRDPDRVARLFLCGDVMLGRGIDQVLPHPCPPHLHEDYVKSAFEYVELAEAAHGPIPRGVSLSYVWGDSLRVMNEWKPDRRIVNLETAVTRCDEAEPKGINYRVSPENAACLSVAGIDCCIIANNHILDWGRAGLLDTVATLQRLGIQVAGAGGDRAGACTPAVLSLTGSGRVVVFAFAATSSGVPRNWSAATGRAGVNVLADLSENTIERVCADVAEVCKAGDLVIASVHWGPNWGYDVSPNERRFAHALIAKAGVSVVHGHSSHHPRPMEVFNGKLILYGCGDFLNDYEGIAGYESYRGDLVLMYFADIDRATGMLLDLSMVPLQVHRFRLQRAQAVDIQWLANRLDIEARAFGSRVHADATGVLTLSWR